MSEVHHLNVVLGYGCHLNDSVLSYLAHAATVIENEKPETSLVVTSGGRTAFRTAPGVSEAELMADHLRALGVEAPIVLEDASRTTVENLRNVAHLIKERQLTPARIEIIGDRARRTKIRALARYFLETRTFRFHPYDLKRSIGETIVQQTLGVAFDGIAARVPAVEQIGLAVVERRIRRS